MAINLNFECFKLTEIALLQLITILHYIGENEMLAQMLGKETGIRICVCVEDSGREIEKKRKERKVREEHTGVSANK